MNESVQTNHPTAPARSGGRPLERRRRLAAIVAALALLPVWAAFAYAGTEPSPVDPEWFVDETKLPFDPLPGPEGAAAQRSWGVLDGAGYRIEVPANWNGELVMWAHGFAGWGAELTVSNPPFRQWLVTNGYAWAASSYGKNGYVVSQGVEDTYKLAQWFTANVGTPSRVFMTGGSMGGHVTAVSLERHAGYYAGALPACGVLGDKELFDFFLDVSLGAQTVTGITTSYPFPDNWQSDVVPQIKAALAADPARAARFANLVKYRSGGDRPLFDVALPNWTDFLFGLAQPNPAARTLDADNLDRVYQLDAEAGVSADEEALNGSIARVGARRPSGPSALRRRPSRQRQLPSPRPHHAHDRGPLRAVLHGAGLRPPCADQRERRPAGPAGDPRCRPLCVLADGVGPGDHRPHRLGARWGGGQAGGRRRAHAVGRRRPRLRVPIHAG